jgi:hypothetical protein
MLSRLEDVLKDKEQELKLHQRFLNLKTFCEEKVFSSTNLPLKEHVETLKGLIEKIIPDPRDRTEEMFSGEIFALLSTLYLHDIGLVKSYKWSSNREILDNLGISNKKFFLNYEIGKILDFPEKAIEIINYLSFSDIVKKIPIECEIVEDGKRAIIRNTKVIKHVFNFSHMLMDIFYSDLRYLSLKRYREPQLVLRSCNTQLDVDSRDGIIYVKYNAQFPYELHVLEGAKQYIVNVFNNFKNNVNGRLGFQYRDIIWDITSDFSYDRETYELAKFSPYDEPEGPPFKRWEEASLILDRLFNFCHVIVVGDAATGKTMVLRSFIIPQIFSVSPNVFYCELWEKPVSELRDIICKRHNVLSYSGLDIISICKNLSVEGPCFFVIDACEKLVGMDAREKEKLERFINFCLDQDNVYLIVSGDKETFFEWYIPFNRMNIAAIYEIKPMKGTKTQNTYGEERIFWDTSEYYKPIEFQLLQANLSLEKVLEDMLREVKDKREFREIVASLVDRNEKYLKRHTLENIFFETYVPHEKILDYINLLKEKDVLKEIESSGSAYYSLTSRYLKEPLYRVLKLGEFEEKKKIRNILQNSIINETFLDGETLKIVEKFRDKMVFSKEEMGLILGSLVLQSYEYVYFFEKAKRDGKGIDIQHILKLIHVDDAKKRREAIELLVEIQDKNMINPLLLHLKKENVLEIKDLLIKGIELTGKKKAIVAIMNTLKEIGDRQLRLKAIEFFYSLFGKGGEKLLIDIKETEDDPIILNKIDSLLSTLKESG